MAGLPFVRLSASAVLAVLAALLLAALAGLLLPTLLLLARFLLAAALLLATLLAGLLIALLLLTGALIGILVLVHSISFQRLTRSFPAPDHNNVPHQTLVPDQRAIGDGMELRNFRRR